ncbi:hypothetical protein VD0002_g6371 [Verticillium dahliae]|uniref:Uncharacterized protein n=1 Tax=Verticillium dahliae TaxID=27337 RepID=A0AA45ALU8_VERDA|nr:hypothetical protein BJF96_g5194 [Verticillium dahliae]PNH61429.1 hypothetical protein VD0002_g6371 [Verticillium dahliae]
MDESSITTPLLAPPSGLPAPAASGRTQDHLPQNALFYIRGFLLAYLIAASIMILDYKVEQEESKFSDWRIIFELEIISFGLLLAYHAIVSEYWVLRFLSLPANMNSLRKQFYFTLFYFLTSIFAIINTMMYFLVTLPHAGSGDDSSPAEPEPSGLGMSKSPTELRDFGVGQSPLLPYGTAGRTPFTDMFGEGWFQAFTTLNLFVISTLIVLVEILFLNSVKRPYAIGAHIFGLLFLSGLYVAWAAVGRTVTGTGPFWLDGDEAVFSLVYGFIAIRETIVKSFQLSRMRIASAAAHDD